MCIQFTSGNFVSYVEKKRANVLMECLKKNLKKERKLSQVCFLDYIIFLTFIKLPINDFIFFDFNQ